jgi:DNA-binding CsgD family transcriptional regulator
MASGAAGRLTDRQRAVMERIDRRVPIKVIAQKLGVSETRINQHIRALKDVYKAGSLGDLVENYRATLSPDAVSQGLVEAKEQAAGGTVARPLSIHKFAAYSYFDLPDLGDRSDPGQLVSSDAMPLIEQVPWLRPGEPRVVP